MAFSSDFILSNWNIYVLCFMFIVMLGSIFMWAKYGKETRVKPIFTPNMPENYNCGEISAIYNGGNATETGIISMIINLANKGFLKIAFDKKNLVFKKVKDYDGEIETEQLMMSALFGANKKTISSEQLRKTMAFSKKCEKILNKFNWVKTQIWERQKSSQDLTIIMSILTGILSVSFMANIFVLFNIPLFSDTYADGDFFPIIFFTILILAPTNDSIDDAGSPNKLLLCWIIIIFDLIIGLVYVLYPFIDIFLNNPIYCVPILIALIFLLVGITCHLNIGKRTITGQVEVAKIVGYREYLAKISFEEKMNIISNNKQYIFEALPFACALEIENKWLKQFEKYGNINPEWYEGNDFSAKRFCQISNIIIKMLDGNKR